MVLHNGCIPTDPSASKPNPVAVQGASESCVTWTERPGVVKTALWWLVDGFLQNQPIMSFDCTIVINESSESTNQPINQSSESSTNQPINQSSESTNQPINQSSESTNQPIPNIWLYLPIVRLGISSESTANPVLFTNQDKMEWQRDFEHCSWLAILVIDLHSGG